MLRPYQVDAFNSVKCWFEKTSLPCLIEAATGAGKSHIIAALAAYFNAEYKTKVLCLAPSRELVEQNHNKFVSSGFNASIYSASISKCLENAVVFGTPVTVLNSIELFADSFNSVIIDEAHGITPTIKKIINALGAPRVVGLSATPYRMDSGYIYAYKSDETNEPEAHDPFFNTLVYQIGAATLINDSYLCPPVCESSDPYCASDLKLNSLGKFEHSEIVAHFEKPKDKTQKIINEIMRETAGKQGVIIFASTIGHAEYISSLIPSSVSIFGTTNKREREQAISDFKAKKIKYLINVSVLTTGFDAPHIDCVVIMRATESAALLQQMIGRGLRLDDDKKECLVLDYAGNIARHCPDGDIFSPTIKKPFSRGEKFYIKARCVKCGFTNNFQGRSNPEKYAISEHGYFLDARGDVVEADDFKVPAHFGRRCNGQSFNNGNAIRCAARWVGKNCYECDAENDIAARICYKCKAELVSPEKKLKRERQLFLKNPRTLTSDKVLTCDVVEHKTTRGEDAIKLTFKTKYRTFDYFVMPKFKNQWLDLCNAVYGRVAPSTKSFVKYFYSRGKKINTVTAIKKDGSNFFHVREFNQPEDIINENT